MIEIPDAPWIREAETYGMPDYDWTPVCPLCGTRDVREAYYTPDGVLVACDACRDQLDKTMTEEELEELSCFDIDETDEEFYDENLC